MKTAQVEAQITVPGGAAGAPLTIARIAPPSLPSPAVPQRIVPPFTEEQRAAMRAAAPLKNLLFTPTVTVYPRGVSLVNWGYTDPAGAHQDFEAWLPNDLTAINIVGDFEVGRTRYSVMGLVHAARGSALTREVPSAEALAGNFRLSKGDPKNADALEPLRALLAIYKADGAEIAASHAAIQARERSFAEWERSNPQPARPAEFRFWPVQSAVYPSASR